MQGRLAVALGLSTAAHVGLAWMVAAHTSSTAAPARRALTVAMTPAAPRAVQNSIAPAVSAPLSPAVVQPVPPPLVTVIEPAQVLAPSHEMTIVDALEPPLVETRQPRQPLRARDGTSVAHAQPTPVAVAAAPMAVTLAFQQDRREKPLPRQLQAEPDAGVESPATQIAAAAPSPPVRLDSSSQPLASRAVAGQPGDDRDALPAAGNEPPRYPWTARAQGYQGRVVLSVWVSAEGDADRLAVVKSSGYPLLDRAAVDAVQRWRFQPARRAGLDTGSLVQVPVVFRLDE
jgi:protein TonB